MPGSGDRRPGDFEVASHLNDELADRLVKASALLHVLGAADSSTLNRQDLSEYTHAMEDLLKDARELQAWQWEWIRQRVLGLANEQESFQSN